MEGGWRLKKRLAPRPLAPRRKSLHGRAVRARVLVVEEKDDSDPWLEQPCAEGNSSRASTWMLSTLMARTSSEHPLTTMPTPDDAGLPPASEAEAEEEEAEEAAEEEAEEAAEEEEEEVEADEAAEEEERRSLLAHESLSRASTPPCDAHEDAWSYDDGDGHDAWWSDEGEASGSRGVEDA